MWKGLKYNRESPPCADCDQRHPRCWANCEGYKAFKQKYEAIKKARQDREAEDRDYVGAHRKHAKSKKWRLS